MDEIFKVTINKFNDSIKLAEKRKLIPIIKGEKKIFPKKYQNENFIWNAKNQLINKDTGDLVARNSMLVGKPRYWKLNGQDIYNQKVKHSARGGIMQKLHAMFEPHLKNIKIEDKSYPISLRINHYTLDYNKEAGKDKNIDNDNKWIYNKVIMDSLRDLKVIPDDNPYYINENTIKTIFVDDYKDIKLEIIGYGE